MKYVVMWETRQSTSEETQARGLQVFSKWSPSEGADFQQFLGRVDGRGGAEVCVQSQSLEHGLSSPRALGVLRIRSRVAPHLGRRRGMAERHQAERDEHTEHGSDRSTARATSSRSAPRRARCF